MCRIVVIGILWLMLVACSNNDSGSAPASYQPSGVIPEASPSGWRQHRDAKSITDAYVIAWREALYDAPGFDSSVAVALLDEGDSVQAFCADKSLHFDVNANMVLYCRAAHEGPDALRQSGAILIAYAFFRNHASATDTEAGQAKAARGAALLIATAYAQHVIAELQGSGDPYATTGRQLAARLDCVIGLTVRAYIPPPMHDNQWDEALAFVRQFQIAGVSTLDREKIKVGYTSGHPSMCLV